MAWRLRERQCSGHKKRAASDVRKPPFAFVW
jgi:hypothetical protein